MKKNFLFLILFCSIFMACKNPVYLPNPNIKPDGGRSEATDKEIGLHAPRNLISTQGHKRAVTLKWKAVDKAVRYNIYRAENEFSDFVQIGETKGRECEFTIKTEPGFDMFFRVSAVDASGKESEKSNIERATTLSVPIINNIEGVPGTLDSSASVSWYMNNLDAYINDVYYNIICLTESNKEVQRQQSKGDNTSVIFTGLNPNTNYYYKVEAYNKLNEVEESNIVDAATARRLTPDPVTNLVATQGTSLDTINVSFVLPNFVDVVVEKNVYEPTPLYFKIYRRVYKEGENTEEFKLIKDDFGINKAESGEVDYTTVKFGKEAEAYKPGNVVTFEDKDVSLRRGEKYEYKVQSFAYVKTAVSSDESVTITTLPGWLLPESSFETLGLNYVKDEKGNNQSASIKFNFIMDTFGIPYKFKIVETKTDIKKLSEPVSTDLEIGVNGAEVDSVDAINQYVKQFVNLKDECGYYKYKIVILSADGTELESHEAVGESLITDQDIPAIGDIKVTSGYADKIVIEWLNDTGKQYTYKLKYWDIDNPQGKEVTVEAKGQANVSYEDKSAKPGMKRTYQLILNNGQFDVPSKLMEAEVPSKPNLIPSYSYDKVTVAVDGAKISDKDNYEVVATFENPSFNNNYELKLIEKGVATPEVVNAADVLSYDFEIVKKGVNPRGNEPIDAEVAGAKVNVSVTEKIPLSIKTYKNENDKKEQTPEVVLVDGEVPLFTEEKGAIQQFNNEIVSAYVGPALLNQKASEGTNADFITVEWDNVLGAKSYVVFRDRYHLKNGGTNKDIELVNKISDKYIVTINEDNSVTVKCEDSELSDNELVKYVSATYNTDTQKITLTDKYREATSTDAGNQWRSGQSEITWGAPNKYTIIPVLSITDAESASKDKGVVGINKLKIANTKDIAGGTKGYGWNVKATQGTYSAFVSKEASAEKINDAIEITWTAPYFGNTDKYVIFRREAYDDNSKWERKYMSAAATTNYVDTTVTQGTIYDYAVFNVKDSSPDLNFIKFQKKGIEGMENKDSLGFILPKPKIDSVSRNDLGINEEEVAFFADEHINSMIDGYVIQVRNNNIDDNWHDIKTIEITPNNVNSVLFTERVTNDKGLLKVLRDYKHYYRIRAYTKVGEEKVYSKPDETTFAEIMADVKDENAYVKWGCRQISNKEFARMIIIGMSTGMETERGSSGCGSDGKGIEGLKSTSSNWGTQVTLKYDNYLAIHDAKGSKNVSAATITGVLHAAGGTAGTYQNYYWTDSPIKGVYNINNKVIENNKEVLKNNMEGSISFINKVYRDSGNITVTWNGETHTYNVTELGLPFAVKGGYINNNPEWQ